MAAGDEPDSEQAHAAADVAERAPAHLPAHRERILEFHARGVLLLCGPFGDTRGVTSARASACRGRSADSDSVGAMRIALRATATPCHNPTRRCPR